VVTKAGLTVYCIYSAMSCMQKKITHKRTRTLDILVKFLIGCLQRRSCSTSVYWALLYK